MSVIDTLLGDIDASMRRPGERRRHALLRRTTATLIDKINELSDHHLTIFDDVILSLALDVDAETRAELSERLADLARGPKKTLHALALDESLRVAKPLIERSACLDDDTLLAIIQNQNEACLTLLAKRRFLPPHVVDHLIAHADDALLVELARNDATSVSDHALRLLAERALTNSALYKILRTRPDLATRHIGAVIEAARFRAQSVAIKPDANDDILSRALARQTAAAIAHTSDLSLSAGAIRTAQERLGRHDVNSLLERDQVNDALIMLAAQIGMSREAVKRVFHAPQYEPLMFLLRAQDYPLTTVMSFMRHKHGSMSGTFEAELSDAYCALACDTAKRLAAFLTERQDAHPIAAERSEPLRRSA